MTSKEKAVKRCSKNTKSSSQRHPVKSDRSLINYLDIEQEPIQHLTGDSNHLDYQSYKNVNLYSVSFGNLVLDNDTDTFVAKLKYIESSKSKSKSKSKPKSTLEFNSGELKFLGLTSPNGYECIEVEFSDNSADYYDTQYSFDNYVTDWVYKNGKSWFGTDLKFDNINSLYSKSILVPTDLNSNPRMNLFIDTTNLELVSQVKKLDYNAHLTCVLCIEGLRFFKNKFELIVKVKHIEKNVTINNDNCISDSSESSYDESLNYDS
jgi:hypothetical protein